MNTNITTTGQTPLTIGSIETFQASAFKNGLPWDLTGGVVNLILEDPSGSQTTISGTISGNGATATWTVTGPENTSSGWRRAWSITDAAGVKQISRPISFNVIASP